jgi:fumarylacetoacetase
MTIVIDHTHDPMLESWVESANNPNTDFPIQNLPFGRFRIADDQTWRIGVAIGDQVLDLQQAGLVESRNMNHLLRLKASQLRELRHLISAGLSRGSNQSEKFQEALFPLLKVQMGLPCQIREYTDFYVGIHHATAVGKLFRPENPLLQNYKWVPIGYHGRASTIGATGHRFPRPVGQTKAADSTQPILQPSQRMDFELELGVVIGQSNAKSVPIGIEDAESFVFGLTLLNDWSARDLQAWEYQPLGPFLSKNFATTVSPWVVTLDALAPFRKSFVRDAADPQPLPYLDSVENRASGAFDIDLQVWLQTRKMQNVGHNGDCISNSNFSDAAYWTVAQLITHHTVSGCRLNSGDLFGTGTLSGPLPNQAGSLLELTHGGKEEITLSNGERRFFLQDDDTVTLRGSCSRPGFRRIGFGECAGTLLREKNRNT